MRFQFRTELNEWTIRLRPVRIDYLMVDTVKPKISEKSRCLVIVAKSLVKNERKERKKKKIIKHLLSGLVHFFLQSLQFDAIYV